METFMANAIMVFVLGFLLTCIVALMGRGILFIENAIDSRLERAEVNKGVFWLIVWAVIAFIVSLSHIGS